MNPVVQSSSARFDNSFAALADATRRGILEQLARGNASITELAGTFDLTLTGMKKHVSVLERAGLVTTEKIGRVRRCRIGPCRLDEEIAWIARYRRVWDDRFQELDRVIDELKAADTSTVRNKRNRGHA